MEIVERYRGCLLGLAMGDALGAAVEFQPPGTFALVTDLSGGGPFELAPGQWTDDTSMALCLAESLIERRGFYPEDQMERYVRWWREGYLSSTGRCFGVGRTVRDALARFEANRRPYAGLNSASAAGNGSLMRMAPVPMFYRRQPAEAIRRAADSSRTTHAVPVAVDACRYFAALLVGALSGVDKDTLLSERYCPVPDYWDTYPLVPEIDDIAAGSFKRRQPPDIRGVGYVARSLEAALWAFGHGTSFRECCLLAVNLGEDADTTGAVCGQLAGAFYGENGLPDEWRRRLVQADLIVALAERLYALSNAPNP